MRGVSQQNLIEIKRITRKHSLFCEGVGGKKILIEQSATRYTPKSDQALSKRDTNVNY